MPQRYLIVKGRLGGRASRNPFLGSPKGLRTPGLESLLGPDPKSGGLTDVAFETATLTYREAKSLAREPEVAGLVPAMPIKLGKPPLRPEANDAAAVGAEAEGPTWGVREVGADRSKFDGSGVLVAVLDTGIDPGHPAFRGVELVRRNFSGGVDDAPDADGHGTHCAGTIFGRAVGGVRIGVAPGVERALIGKVLDDQGDGDSAAVFEGIRWAVGAGAHVLSMSIGFDFPGMVDGMIREGVPADLAASRALVVFAANLRMFDALMGTVRAETGFGHGCVVVAATGNESRRELDPSYEVAAALPGSAEGVVSVGALRKTAHGLTVPSFSNTLPILCAPGVQIRSAERGTGGLTAMDGTSMATPHVAGVAALWWQQRLETSGRAKADEVVSRLRAHARADVFASNVDREDRGEGLATAPL